MERDRTKDEIDNACALADYHVNELVEGLIPGVEELSEALRQDIGRRLASMFYAGVDYGLETK